MYECETDGQLFSDDSVNFEPQSDGKNLVVYVQCNKHIELQ